MSVHHNIDVCNPSSMKVIYIGDKLASEYGCNINRICVISGYKGQNYFVWSLYNSCKPDWKWFCRVQQCFFRVSHESFLIFQITYGLYILQQKMVCFSFQPHFFQKLFQMFETFHGRRLLEIPTSVINLTTIYNATTSRFPFIGPKFSSKGFLL